MATAQELRILYAHSGNKCAFEGCTSPIFEDSGTLTGECAHIRARSAGGPRYDALQTQAQRDSIENLILLCSRHHTIIDQEVENYPVERLIDMKQRHESQFGCEQLELNRYMLQKLEISEQIHSGNLNKINNQEDSLSLFRTTVDIDADILDTYESLLENIKNLVSFSDCFAQFSLNSQSNLYKLFDNLGLDKSLLGNLPNENNPFSYIFGDNINGYHNSSSIVDLRAQHLYVKILELMVERDHSYFDKLQTERNTLEHLLQNSFVD